MPEFSVSLCWAFGLLASVLVERLLQPRPPLRRPLWCWRLHVAIWSIAFAVLLGLTARPLFSTVNTLVLWLLIVLVSNSKYHSLREPFVCADFEYFSDAVRFPRLYLPFFGFTKAALMAAAFLAYLWAGLSFEPEAGAGRLEAALLALFGFALLLPGTRNTRAPSFDASADLLKWGLAASLWRYFWAARQPVDRGALASPFATQEALPPGNALPDLVSVQSESFFDVRDLWPGIKAGVLGEFDRLNEEALACGKLQVAAWGANTVRTEFAYLTGIQAQQMGVHRFNPYRILARRALPSIAAQLKARGYRTVCIHPYDGSFYGRDKVLPALGFDEFIDIRAFEASQKSGPFIGDMALAEKVIELLDAPERNQPLFIHVITMENHGPLHLESVTPEELPQWFERPLLDGLDDLAPYLRHVANADHMLGRLRSALLEQPRDALLCFFGDHVPILPKVYEVLGAPVGDTDYFIWSNRQSSGAPASALPVERLARRLLECARLRAPATAEAVREL